MDYKQKYQLAFDEINSLATASFRLSKNHENVKDDVLSFLVNGYVLGASNANEMLASQVAVNTEQMREAIYKNIGGKTFEDRVEDHLAMDDIAGLIVLAQSEFHRVYNAGAEDTAVTYSKTVAPKMSVTGGQVVYKEWLTMLDDKVREAHDYLEGQRVPVGEDFYTYDGDHGPYPGGFGEAENNVNCRCIVEYRIDGPREGSVNISHE